MNDVQTQLKNEDSALIAKTRKAAKRRAESVVDQSRIKRRKLGAGRQSKKWQLPMLGRRQSKKWQLLMAGNMILLCIYITESKQKTTKEE